MKSTMDNGTYTAQVLIYRDTSDIPLASSIFILLDLANNLIYYGINHVNNNVVIETYCKLRDIHKLQVYNIIF